MRGSSEIPQSSNLGFPPPRIAEVASELTIAIVVSRDGLEKAVRAVHAECGMGRRNLLFR